MNKQIIKKTILKLTVALIMAASCITTLCACSSDPGETLSSADRAAIMESKKSNLKVHNHIKNMLGFDIDDSLIEGAELTLDTDNDSTYGKVKITIKSGKNKDVLSLLQKNLGTEKNVEPWTVPDYQNHQYAVELKQMTSIKNFVNSSSSATVNIYMAQKGSTFYLFLFG